MTTRAIPENDSAIAIADDHLVVTFDPSDDVPISQLLSDLATYVEGKLSNNVSESRVQELINATALSALQGMVTNGQIPDSIMRDAEFSAAAVRGLLGLSSSEVNDLLTGATLVGQILTFTQNDGSTVPITIPTATPGAGDGVVTSGVFNADQTELILTLDTGGTVTISVPDALRRDGVVIQLGSSYDATTGTLTLVRSVGDDIVISGFPIGGIPATHTEQYLAGNVTQNFVTGDFEGAQGVAYPDNSHTATMPDVVGNVFAGVARINTDPEPTYADVNNQGINQFSDFTKQADEIEINSAMYEVWVSDYAVFSSGDTVEFR